jgi:chitinase
MLKSFLASIIVLSIASAASADWPKRVFAPYMYIGAGDNFKLTECDDACGLKYYTLAFMIALQSGNGPDAQYQPQPSWDGRIPMGQNLYKDQINAIRERGGDVIMSFGGEAGREIAIIITDPVALQAAYQSIIDRYKFTWLDFDIEGDNLDKYQDASQRRNTVLAALQAKNPGLRISYTLPVDPHGISDSSQALLADAKAKGLKVFSANLMVMYFGSEFVGKGRSEGQLGIDSANTARAQIQKIDPDIQIGLCPCLGRNGSRNEVFGLEDAKTLFAFASQTPWVVSLHYWSINDDAARPRRRRRATTQATTRPASTTPPAVPWAFAKIFMPFTNP